MTTTVNGILCEDCTLTMPRVGAWHADVKLNEETELPEAIVIESDGQVFTGSKVRSRPFAGATTARVVGGGGGLSRTIEARNYASGPTVQTVLSDILGDKETLSDTADQGILSSQLPAYHLVEGRASHALTRLLDKVSATWRVLPDGTVWVGQESYPEQVIDHQVIDEDWFSGSILIAPDAPSLRPGVTFLGHEIELVVHSISAKETRTEASVTSAGSALGKFLGQIRRQIDYTKRWPARVSKDNGDGTVQLVPDDPRIKAGGLDRVRVRSGIPGKITTKKGARCLLGFDGGDPSMPYASDWDGEDVVEIQIADGQFDAARVGSTVEVYFPPLMPVSGTLSGAPFTGLLTITTPGYGLVKDGNPKIKE